MVCSACLRPERVVFLACRSHSLTRSLNHSLTHSLTHIEHCVHVIVKNLQSIRYESRWEDFIAELDQCDFDLLLICETWRGERDDSFITERGNLRSRRCRLVVFAIEIGGRWSQEATTFLRLLAHTKARAAPDILCQAVEASLPSRWSAILTHAAQHAFAASLLDLDCAGASTASLRSPRPTPAHQSCPSPPLRSRDLDLAGFPCTSGAAGIEMALPGD